MSKITNHIWYKRPAERWTECIPLGNGSQGAMLYGKVNEDLIQLNEETIWDGNYDYMGNPKAADAMPKVRQLIFDGKIKEAAAMVDECIVSVPRKFGSYAPFADLVISASDLTRAGDAFVPRVSDFKKYKRELFMDQGIAVVSYEKNNVKYRREYFVSYPDQVMVIRYTNEGNVPGDYMVTFRQGSDTVCKNKSEDTIYYENQLCEGGVKYCGCVKVVADDGRAAANIWAANMGYVKPMIEADGVSSMTCYVSITSDYWKNDYDACFERVEKAAAKGYEAIKADHIADFSECYNRFSLELSDKPRRDMSIPEWLDDVRQGNITPKFTELYVNFNRYTLISASRKGTLPSNLQGIWNDQFHASCESDFHTNINLQINYWPAHAWGLSDCAEPLVDWMEALVPYGEEMVQKYYGAKGWTVHHCSNIFGYTVPNFDSVGLWPVGGPWMCRHLYEQWLYTGDYEEMRNRIYPMIRGNVEFFLDFVVEAPEGSACPGKLVTNPSMSPENTYIMENGEGGMLTYASTMDIEILHDIFDICKELIGEIQKKETGFDADFVKAIDEVQTRLPEIKVSAKHGGVQEWIEDYDEADQGHRHVSQLYGVYPGTLISDEKTPQLATAARRTIERKYEAGYDGQGWSLTWLACILARLKDGDKAYDMLCEIYRRHVLTNLMINAHGFVQVGDAEGVPAAVMEMLVQMKDGEVVLLPALPKAWPKGKVKGLRLPGGFILDMEWKDGEVVWAELEATFNPDIPVMRMA